MIETIFEMLPTAVVFRLLGAWLGDIVRAFKR